LRKVVDSHWNEDGRLPEKHATCVYLKGVAEWSVNEWSGVGGKCMMSAEAVRGE